jgi:hypothetical protein
VINIILGTSGILKSSNVQVNESKSEKLMIISLGARRHGEPLDHW